MNTWLRGILQTHWFTLALAGVFSLAWLAPGVGPMLNPHDRLRDAAIVLVFFNTGLVMRTAEALRAAAAWHVHVFVQGFCFIAIPLMAWLLLLPLRGHLPEGLIIGFCLLAVLPITITSCVIFTQMAGGHVAAAVFNGIVGNLAGIVIAPALLLVMLGGEMTSIELDALAIVRKLSMLVLLPFGVGMVCGMVVGARRVGWRKPLAQVNSVCILLVVYLAFCSTFLDESLGISIAGVALPLLALVPAHLGLLALAWWGAGWCGFERGDRIAALFSAPHKTLALGLPIIAACLATRPELQGLATMPILVYHPLQLTVGALLIPYVAIQQPPD